MKQIKENKYTYKNFLIDLRPPDEYYEQWCFTIMKSNIEVCQRFNYYDNKQSCLDYCKKFIDIILDTDSEVNGDYLILY